MKNPQHIHKFIKKSPELARILSQVSYLQKLNTILKQNIRAPLNEHCLIANVKTGQIILHTDSAAWATQLRYEMPALLECINRYEEYVNITEISIKIRPNYAQDIKIRD